MRVLIVKLTSMGDLMHAFPSLTDAAERFPDISFDWVVDEGFAEVPLWHPRVDQTITTAHRRWRKNVLACWRAGEFSDFSTRLNKGQYDRVLDLQGNLKSAVVSWLRKGPVHGYDSASCREKPAHWAYRHHYRVATHQHAIERQRQLMARVLGYDAPKSAADYGVDADRFSLSDSLRSELQLPDKYVVFVHNASRANKLWPVASWQALLREVAAAGYSAILPSGNQAELEQARVIASSDGAALVLPKLSLNDTAAVMRRARAAICSDTGLAHMAAVLSTPAVTLYAVTHTGLIGTYGRNQHHLVAGSDHQGSMNDLSVDQVWKKLRELLDLSE